MSMILVDTTNTPPKTSMEEKKTLFPSKSVFQVPYSFSWGVYLSYFNRQYVYNILTRPMARL